MKRQALTLAIGFVLGLLGVALATDRSPSSIGGYIYKATPEAMTDGGIDSMHADRLNRLVVTDIPADVTARSPVAATGTSSVTVISAVAAKRVYLLTFMVSNTDTVSHTVHIRGSGGTDLFPAFTLAAGSAFVLDGRGDVATPSGEGLSMVLDEAGTAVKAGGFYVQR